MDEKLLNAREGKAHNIIHNFSSFYNWIWMKKSNFFHFCYNYEQVDKWIVGETFGRNDRFIWLLGIFRVVVSGLPIEKLLKISQKCKYYFEFWLLRNNRDYPPNFVIFWNTDSMSHSSPPPTFFEKKNLLYIFWLFFLLAQKCQKCVLFNFFSVVLILWKKYLLSFILLILVNVLI